MAELPDLDQTEISYLAFWNPISEGYVDSVSPGDVTSDPNITGTVTYDNGMQGTYDLTPFGNPVEVNWRVKNDGWFVVWRDRSKTFGTLSNSYLDGPWSAIQYWGSEQGANLGELSPNNAFERAIYNMAQELSNFGDIAYDGSQVGLVNYETGPNYVSSLLSGQANISGYNNYNDETYRFEYGTGTELGQAWAGTCHDGYGSDYANAYYESSESINGNTQWRIGSENFGTINLLAYGDNDIDLMPNPNTPYGNYGEADTHANDSYYSHVAMHILVQWR